MILALQFEMECRPFYVSGFNAHDLVPKSLATPADHNTVGQSCRALLSSLYAQSSACSSNAMTAVFWQALCSLP